jgi:hypothetical protein
VELNYFLLLYFRPDELLHIIFFPFSERLFNMSIRLQTIKIIYYFNGMNIYSHTNQFKINLLVYESLLHAGMYYCIQVTATCIMYAY